MFRLPNYQENLSLRLSQVLDDIGVNEKMVIKRRKAVLLQETITTITYRSVHRHSVYQFGSQSEGTTTNGLQSDTDMLCCDHKCNVIQDYADWEPGFINLLMIQDNTTSPGYCLLQLIRDDVPLPAIHVLDEHYVRDINGRVLLKNTVYRDIKSAGRVQHGPSLARQGKPGILDSDFVFAFSCNSWPYEARAWLDRQGIGRWPTANMKRFAENNGCFVVPVGSKVSQNPELEWRISTSQAERCLMFSLNITQIHCYVLMKMIIKTFLHHAGEGHITSFMCKTVLLHCIENTNPDAWQENNLFTCLSCCLHVLYNCLQQENCPHFITPDNNLMAGQFSPEVKALLLERMFHFIESDGQALLQVQTDALGGRLMIKLSMLHQLVEIRPSNEEIALDVSRELLVHTTGATTECYSVMLKEALQNNSVATEQHLRNEIMNLARYSREGSRLEQKASRLLAPLVCSTLGTIKASFSIQRNNTIPADALVCLSAGLNSDVTSSRLKLASVFYSVGNMVSTEFILRDTEGRYSFQKVEPICKCCQIGEFKGQKTFDEEASYQNEKAVRSVCAFCVRFIPAEIKSVPCELQYETFRSTRDDLQYRDEDDDYWMDWAVVDSLPYLYFLQYKTYGHLQRLEDQQRALSNLIRTIETEKNLGHRETALNLLGQCMEQENQPDKALLCYMISLKVRERNNVAGIHICRLLASLMRAKELNREKPRSQGKSPQSARAMHDTGEPT